jgi:hypothetical protein
MVDRETADPPIEVTSCVRRSADRTYPVLCAQEGVVFVFGQAEVVPEVITPL